MVNAVKGFWVNFRICGKIFWKIMALRTQEQKIEGGWSEECGCLWQSAGVAAGG